MSGHGAEITKIKVTILGSDSIGTDFMIKTIKHSEILELAVIVRNCWSYR